MFQGVKAWLWAGAGGRGGRVPHIMQRLERGEGSRGYADRWLTIVRDVDEWGKDGEGVGEFPKEISSGTRMERLKADSDTG